MSNKEQEAIIERNRLESNLSRNVPLGAPPIQSPGSILAGLTAAEWFRRKHQAGHFGKYFPLHLTQTLKQQE